MSDRTPGTTSRTPACRRLRKGLAPPPCRSPSYPPSMTQSLLTHRSDSPYSRVPHTTQYQRAEAFDQASCRYRSFAALEHWALEMTKVTVSQNNTKKESNSRRTDHGRSLLTSPLDGQRTKHSNHFDSNQCSCKCGPNGAPKIHIGANILLYIHTYT